jgi:hypothetical protein
MFYKMQYLKPFGNKENKVNEEILGINRAIKRSVGTYKDPVYVYIIHEDNKRSRIENDWVGASNVNRKLMEMLNDRFDVEVNTDNVSKVRTEDIDKIGQFLKNLGLVEKKFTERYINGIFYRGRLSMKDLHQFNTDELPQ